MAKTCEFCGVSYTRCRAAAGERLWQEVMQEAASSPELWAQLDAEVGEDLDDLRHLFPTK